MKLNVESRIPSDTNPELELLNGELEVYEALMEYQEAMTLLEEAEAVLDNTSTLKSTVESYGLSDDVLYLADQDGSVCELLNLDERPSVTRENKSELEEKLRITLEASASQAWEKTKEMLQKLVQVITDLVDKVINFIRNFEEQINDERKRISDIDYIADSSVEEKVHIPAITFKNQIRDKDPQFVVEPRYFSDDNLRYMARQIGQTADTLTQSRTLTNLWNTINTDQIKVIGTRKGDTVQIKTVFNQVTNTSQGLPCECIEALLDAASTVFTSLQKHKKVPKNIKRLVNERIQNLNQQGKSSQNARQQAKDLITISKDEMSAGMKAVKTVLKISRKLQPGKEPNS